MSTIEAPEPFLFVSYASLDQARVMEIVAALEGAGYRVWVDREGIPGGVSYGPEITAALRGCCAMLLCCSANAFASRNVRQEIQIAWKHERPILPLLLEPITIPDELEYWLEGSQWIELFDRPADDWLPVVARSLRTFGLPGGAGSSGTSSALPPPAGKVAGNLPIPATPLIGREREVERVVSLLQRPDVRLVTLVGPGGVGKTRLAIAVAGELRPAFPQGAWFIDLSPIARPDLVLATIVATLGINEQGQRPLADRLHEHLRARRLLLLVDNVEHVADARSVIAEILGHAPDVRILATGRAPLHISGEHEVQVDPLALPDSPGSATAAAARESPAVQLFVQRAEAVRPGFALNDENAAAVAGICARLDGLPLAVEIAAARVKVVPPAVLLGRLEKRLPVLTGGPRDLPSRQQALRDAIAWSYDLLSTEDRALLRRLGVFAGGCTLEAIEEVANPDGGIDVFEGVASLIDKSLLRQDESGDEPRFRMLETIREFAQEQLGLAGEADEVQARFADWCIRLADGAFDPMLFPGLEHLGRLAADYINVRTALTWLYDQRDRERILRLTRSLHGFWWVHSHRAEGLTWIEQAIDRYPDAPAVDRGYLHSLAGIYRYYIGDVERGRQLAESGLKLVREEADAWTAAHAMYLLAVIVTGEGSYPGAMALATEAIDGFREAGDPGWEAMALELLATAAMCMEVLPLAERSIDRALTLLEGHDATWPLGLALERSAVLALKIGNLPQAASVLKRIEPIWTNFGSTEALGEWLMLTASVTHPVAEPERLARLVGTAEQIRETLGSIWEEPQRSIFEATISQVRSSLGADAYRDAALRGRAVSVPEAVADGRALLDLVA